MNILHTVKTLPEKANRPECGGENPEMDMADDVPSDRMLNVASVSRAAPRRAGWVLAILCGVYVLNFLDRQLLAILAKPIQEALHLTDGQLGRITGLYFAFFYCFIAIPVGWVADRTNRVHVLAFACAIWSAATAACGLAANYGQLVVARMTVGFGEAGGVPPSYSLISDYFPRERRGRALAIYNLGPPIGAAVGTAFGASIAAALSWRAAFLIVGAAGLVAALVVKLAVREPARGESDAKPVVSRGAPFWRTVGMYFTTPVLLLAGLASGVTQLITYGMGNFAVLFLEREKGMTPYQIAIWYALVVLIGMGGGIFASGRAIDRFVPRHRAAYALIPATTLTIALPLYLGFVWSPGWPLALVLLTGTMAFNYFFLSACVALVQEEVRPDQRVLAGALLLLLMNFIGLGLGPTFVGAASDWFAARHHQHTLQLALYALTPCYIFAILLFLWLARLLRRDTRVAE